MTKPESQAEIDGLVSRLLHDADALDRFPTPIDAIVAAQHLHLSDTDDSPFAPAMIAQAPIELQRQLQKFRSKLLGALDRGDRAVYVAPDVLPVQRRFIACHETGHDLCPWQAVRYQLDSWEQLEPGIRQAFEQEANYAASELLFQQAVFTRVASSYPLGAVAVKQLAELFGASIHATFRQYVERQGQPVLGLVLSRSPVGAHPASYCFAVNQVLASTAFTHLFPFADSPPRQLTSATYPQLATAWNGLRRGDITSDHLSLPTRDGQHYLLDFELFSNTYHLFMLAIKPRLERRL